MTEPEVNPSHETEPREPDEVLAPDLEDDGSTPRFRLETVGKNATEVVENLREDIQYWLDRGRYNKIRIKRKGKPVLPDIPIGAIMAFEAATFFWTGLLRGAVVNVVGRAFFEVEMINEAGEHYQTGLDAFLAGELFTAETALEKALRIDPRFARAHLRLGIVRKMQGRNDDAQLHFEEAIIHGERQKTRQEAEAQLRRLTEETALTKT